MRINLVADVHNHVAELANALAEFRKRGVDQVVTLGDTCDAFSRGDAAGEVTSLLNACSAVGVWGNHDFTLCRDVPTAAREDYSAAVLEVMATMQPHLVISGCHFSHKESSVDPYDVTELWELSDSRLDLMERASLAFAATEIRWQFLGHYHQWWAATPLGPESWIGIGPLQFDFGRRYFVVVAAVCDGWCGILDTEQGYLFLFDAAWPKMLNTIGSRNDGK